MDDNYTNEQNSSSFECEPMGDPNHDNPYEPQNQQQKKPKKEKKDHTTAKIVALVAAVALIGSIGGSLLTGAIVGLRPDKQEAMQTQEQVPEDDKKDYELVVHQLPDKLNSNDTGKSLTTAQVYEQTVNSVVGITTESTTNIFGQEAVAASAGSGFILSEDGYIITNCHVVEGADTIKVSLFNGDEFPAELVGADKSYDIAVLKIDAKGLPAVSVGDSDQLHVGENVVAIGNPLGELTFTMTNGILSALDREINTDGNPQNMLQTNAAINSGNSGGPLFDMDGNVIGVTTAKYSGSTSSGTTIEGLGFAIPINEALRVAYDLAEYGYVKGQAYLGVVVKTIPDNVASYYGLPIGPRVENVNPGSCAEKAGIQVGDIVMKFNGKEVENNPALLSALKKVKAGEVVNMTLFRSGAEVEVSVTLDERPSEEEISQREEEQQKQEEQKEEYVYEFPEGFPGIPGLPFGN